MKNSKKRLPTARKGPNPMLRELYATGLEVLEERARQQDAGEGVQGTYERLGAHTAAAKRPWHEARRFAELYDEKALEKLCALGQKSGRPISPIQAVLLTRLTSRKQRDALAQKCASKAWSVRRLDREIQLLRPRRKYGGQRFMPPTSIDEALVTAEQMAERWVRWIRVLRSAKKNAKQHSVKLSELPRPVRRSLTAITREAELLSAVIEQQLKPTVARPRKRPRRK
jgi:hypothetical protein